MSKEQFEDIMKRLDVLEQAARYDCGCYIQECISDVREAVLSAKPED